MRIDKFEKLECWKEAKKLVNMVYDAVKGSKTFQKGFEICKSDYFCYSELTMFVDMPVWYSSIKQSI